MFIICHELKLNYYILFLSLQDYSAKLSDFGLAKDGPEGDDTHVSTRVMGTQGYAAPEYIMTGNFNSYHNLNPSSHLKKKKLKANILNMFDIFIFRSLNGNE